MAQRNCNNGENQLAQNFAGREAAPCCQQYQNICQSLKSIALVYLVTALTPILISCEWQGAVTSGKYNLYHGEKGKHRGKVKMSPW